MKYCISILLFIVFFGCTESSIPTTSYAGETVLTYQNQPYNGVSKVFSDSLSHPDLFKPLRIVLHVLTLRVMAILRYVRPAINTDLKPQ